MHIQDPEERHWLQDRIEIPHPRAEHDEGIDPAADDKQDKGDHRRGLDFFDDVHGNEELDDVEGDDHHIDEFDAGERRDDVAIGH